MNNRPKFSTRSKRKIVLSVLLGMTLLVLVPITTYGDWTWSTSDGDPPLTCQQGDLVSAFHCSGKYCDDVYLDCADTNYNVVYRNWQKYISEENTGIVQNTGGTVLRRNNYMQLCPAGFITGVSCTGKYCDNISFECSKINGYGRSNCFWTGWLSEESGTMWFPYGYYAAGMQCSGSHCDNKRFYACQARGY